MATDNVSIDDLWHNLLDCAYAMDCHPMTVLERVIEVAREERIWDEPYIMQLRTTIAKRGLTLYETPVIWPLSKWYPRESWCYWENN